MLGLGWILLVHVDESELVPWTKKPASMTSTPLKVQAVGCSSRAIAAQRLISTRKPVEQNEQLAAAIVTALSH